MALVLTKRNLDLGGGGGAARLFHLFLFYVPCSPNHENIAEVLLGDPEAFPYCSQAFFGKFGQAIKSLEIDFLFRSTIRQVQ